MKRIRFFPCLLLPVTMLWLGCVSASPQAQNVRVTSNPDVVKGCEFLGNVKAMSGWGGSAAGGLAARNIEETLKERTFKLGGNVVFVVQNASSKGTGEAYRCPESAPQP